MCRSCVVVEGTDRSADIAKNIIYFQKTSVSDTCSRFACNVGTIMQAYRTEFLYLI
jgi:hypothetical protein